MQNTYLQPDPNTCVPTSFVYLLYKLGKVDFESFLHEIIKRCYELYDLQKDGMEFDQMQVVAKEFGFNSKLSKRKPNTKAYLTGVNKLPLCKYNSTKLFNLAVQEGSVKIKDNYFIYPFGHALTVFGNDKETVKIFDSLLGFERNIQLKELENCLEQPTNYLSLV